MIEAHKKGRSLMANQGWVWKSYVQPFVKLLQYYGICLSNLLVPELLAILQYWTSSHQCISFPFLKKLLSFQRDTPFAFSVWCKCSGCIPGLSWWEVLNGLQQMCVLQLCLAFVNIPICLLLSAYRRTGIPNRSLTALGISLSICLWSDN